MRTHAIFFTAPNEVELREVEVPEPARGEVLLKTLYSAVSPGTELRCLAGQQPNAEPFPFVPGYAQVGQVLQLGEGVTDLREGDVVFAGGSERLVGTRMWGGHIAHAVTTARPENKLADGADPLACSLAKLAAIGLRGVRLAQPRPAERCLNVGLGPIGQMSARLMQLAGASVVALDPVAGRVELARGVGLDARVVEGSLVESGRKAFPEAPTLLVDSTGSGAVFRDVVELAYQKPWSDVDAIPVRLVVQGSYPGDLAIPYQEAFLKEAAVLFPRDNLPSDLRICLDWISSGRLIVRDLVSKLASPHEAPAIYASLRNREPGMIGAAFDWSLM